jgi:hypothetical protein
MAIIADIDATRILDFDRRPYSCNRPSRDRPEYLAIPRR